MNKKMKDNLIVTGIPRSGTTLTTSLLDSLSNSVCLSEPSWQGDLFKKTEDVNKLIKRLKKDFTKVRKKILNNKPISDRRTEDGLPLTNYIKYEKNGKTIKNKLERSTYFKVNDEDFLLGMKHNAHYTSILPELADCPFFSIIAVVRHPVPTILSWEKVNFPISRGKLPGAEKFWPEIKKISDSNDALLIKQVKIYELFIERYMTLKNKIHLLKYENLVTEPHLLEKLTKKSYERKSPIKAKGNNRHYNTKMTDEIKEALIKYAPHALKMYSLIDF